jgi:hypothetical protein
MITILIQQDDAASSSTYQCFGTPTLTAKPKLEITVNDNIDDDNTDGVVLGATGGTARRGSSLVHLLKKSLSGRSLQQGNTADEHHQEGSPKQQQQQRPHRLLVAKRSLSQGNSLSIGQLDDEPDPKLQHDEASVQESLSEQSLDINELSVSKEKGNNESHNSSITKNKEDSKSLRRPSLGHMLKRSLSGRAILQSSHQSTLHHSNNLRSKMAIRSQSVGNLSIPKKDDDELTKQDRPAVKENHGHVSSSGDLSLALEETTAIINTKASRTLKPAETAEEVVDDKTKNLSKNSKRRPSLAHILKRSLSGRSLLLHHSSDHIKSSSNIKPRILPRSMSAGNVMKSQQDEKEERKQDENVKDPSSGHASSSSRDHSLALNHQAGKYVHKDDKYKINGVKWRRASDDHIKFAQLQIIPHDALVLIRRAPVREGSSRRLSIREGSTRRHSLSRQRRLSSHHSSDSTLLSRQGSSNSRSSNIKKVGNASAPDLPTSESTTA